MSQISARLEELAKIRTLRSRSNLSAPSSSAGAAPELSSIPYIYSRGHLAVKRDMEKAVSEQISNVCADVACSIEDALFRLRAEFEERSQEEILRITATVEQSLSRRAAEAADGNNRIDPEIVQTVTNNTNALGELRTDVNILLKDLRSDRDHVDSQFTKVASRLTILETQEPRSHSYRIGNPLLSQQEVATSRGYSAVANPSHLDPGARTVANKWFTFEPLPNEHVRSSTGRRSGARTRDSSSSVSRSSDSDRPKSHKSNSTKRNSKKLSLSRRSRDDDSGPTSSDSDQPELD